MYDNSGTNYNKKKNIKQIISEQFNRTFSYREIKFMIPKYARPGDWICQGP